MTTRAAIRFAAGPAAGVVLTASTAALAREVLKSMLIHKLKLRRVDRRGSWCAPRRRRGRT